jgi:Holliday junction resolvase RusA-like endonuclease
VTTYQESIRFEVFGEARPAGSKRAFVNPHTGQAIVTDDSGKKGKTWRADIQAAAREAYDGPLLDGALDILVTFYRARPKSHYRTGKNADLLKDSAPRYPTARPDATKLLRAVEDALTGIIWVDDSLIVSQHAFKRFADDGRPKVKVEVRPAQTWSR